MRYGKNSEGVWQVKDWKPNPEDDYDDAVNV